MNQVKKYFWIILISVLCVIPGKVEALDIENTFPVNYQEKCSDATNNYIYYINDKDEKVWIYCKDMTSGSNSIIELCNSDKSLCYLPKDKNITMNGFNAKALVINNLADKQNITLDIADDTVNRINGSSGEAALIIESSSININAPKAKLSVTNSGNGETGNAITIKDSFVDFKIRFLEITEIVKYVDTGNTRNKNSAIAAKDSWLSFLDSRTTIDVKPVVNSLDSKYEFNYGYAIHAENTNFDFGTDDTYSEYDNNLIINTNFNGIYLADEDGDNDSQFQNYSSSAITLNYSNNFSLADSLLDVRNYNIFNQKGKLSISPKGTDDNLGIVVEEVVNPVVFKNINELSMGTYATTAIKTKTTSTGDRAAVKIWYDEVGKKEIIIGGTATKSETRIINNSTSSDASSIYLKNATLNTAYTANNPDEFNIQTSTSDSNYYEKYKDKDVYFVPGKDTYINSSDFMKLSVSGNGLVHYGYELEMNLVKDESLNSKIAKENEKLFGVYKIKFVSPDGVEVFDLPNSAVYYLDIKLPEDMQNSDMVIGRILTANGDSYDEKEIDWKVGENSFDDSGINWYATFATDFSKSEIENGIYISLSEVLSGRIIKDKDSGVIITAPTELEGYTLEVTNGDDAFIETINGNLNDAEVEKTYKLELNTTATSTLPNGTYEVKIPALTAEKDKVIQIYSVDSTGNTIKAIPFKEEDGYYIFNISKSDLGTTSYAIGRLPSTGVFSYDDFTISTELKELYYGCKFELTPTSSHKDGLIHSVYNFSYDCGDEYIMPDDVSLRITIPRPEYRENTELKVYDDVNLTHKVIWSPYNEKMYFYTTSAMIDDTTYTLVYYEPCPDVTTNKYILKFDVNGGKAITDMEVVIGSTDKIPTPERDGYEFDGWYYDETYSNSMKVDTTVASQVNKDLVVNIENGCPTEYYASVTIHAKWNKVEEEPETPENPTCNVAMNFKLTYITNGGTAIPAETITTNTTGTLPIPEKENNTFKGWYYDEAYTKPVAEKSTKADLAKPITENNCITGYSDVTIYAKWESASTDPETPENPTCTNAAMNFKLTYVTNGGTAIPAESITKNTTGTLPTPEKENNTFKGWYYDEAYTKPVAEKSTKIDLAKPITENNCITGYSDVTIYAKWETTSTDPETPENPDTPSKPNCDTPRTLITIKYNTNGGKSIDEHTYDSDVEFSVLKSTEKENYIFDGWYYDEGLETKATADNWREKINSIPLAGGTADPDTGCETNRTGQLNLYAKWNANSINEEDHTITSQDGNKIYNSLLEKDGNYKFITYTFSKNSSNFSSNIKETVTKQLKGKTLIDIYKFNLTDENSEQLPNGKYKIKLLITDNMKNFENLEMVQLSENGTITDRKITLSKDGDYYVFEIDQTDLGKTQFALIETEIKQVPTGVYFKTGAFVLLIGGLGFIGYKIKKRRKVYSI